MKILIPKFGDTNNVVLLESTQPYFCSVHHFTAAANLQCWTWSFTIWLLGALGHRESLERSRPVTQASVTIAAVLNLIVCEICGCASLVCPGLPRPQALDEVFDVFSRTHSDTHITTDLSVSTAQPCGGHRWLCYKAGKGKCESVRMEKAKEKRIWWETVCTWLV